MNYVPYRRTLLTALATLCMLAVGAASAQSPASDPLPSWNDSAAKAAIIGRRPIFAAGNSDGGLQVLQWTALAPGPRFAMIVHHTDGDREWAYDRQSHVGKLDKALDEARKQGWVLVDMKQDWKVVYPFQD
jgi:hypothetical protein